MDGGMFGLISDEYEYEDTTTLQCFPLFSTLLALDNPTVNFLSLDIEGAEFEVLKTIPWDKVDIEVIVAELLHAGEVDDDIQMKKMSSNNVFLLISGVSRN